MLDAVLALAIVSLLSTTTAVYLGVIVRGYQKRLDNVRQQNIDKYSGECNRSISSILDYIAGDTDKPEWR